MNNRIKEIKSRLSSVTVKGKWWAVKSNSNVLIPHLCKDNVPYYSQAEDDSILGDDGREVLGCSEWLRCDWKDLEFMAHAKEDIEFLLSEIDRIQISYDS